MELTGSRDHNAAGPVTIFSAAEIVTMDPRRPTATHVAVCEGKILGVGPLEELTVWGEYTLDDRFSGHVLVPGMVEAHSHVFEGAVWEYPYVGYFARRGPSGEFEGGHRSLAELLERLRAEHAALSDPAQPLFCWGLDPLYFSGERLTAEHLDTVSSERQIIVMHASLHLATVNSAALLANGIDESCETEGIQRDEAGRLTGELLELPAMLRVAKIGSVLRDLSDPRHLSTLGRQAVNAGVTTLTNLAGGEVTVSGTAEAIAQRVEDPDFPIRLVTYCLPGTLPLDEVIARFVELRGSGSDKLVYGGIKLIGDGSIQGFTAVMRWPGYVGGAPQGLWQVDPGRLREMVRSFHEAGINVHIHANGDATIDAALDAVDHALRHHAWLDHRHTLQHSQLTTPAQYRVMAALGMCANIFTNHLWFWGDQHFESTVGPDRAHTMESCATAVRERVRFAIHSDAPVTPLGQLHTMWCAVNRVTATGRVLGSEESITAYEALRAVTIDAAYQLHLDHVIGSIEIGKHADFTVLDTNPLTCDPATIRDIGVWGTVLAGVPHQAA